MRARDDGGRLEQKREQSHEQQLWLYILLAVGSGYARAYAFSFPRLLLSLKKYSLHKKSVLSTLLYSLMCTKN